MNSMISCTTTRYSCLYDKNCRYVGNETKDRPHLSHHLVVRVSRQRNTLQGGDSPGKQRHVGRHRKGYLERGVQQVLGKHLHSTRQLEQARMFA